MSELVWWSPRDEERGQVTVTWNQCDNRFHVCAEKASGRGTRADMRPRDAVRLAMFLLQHALDDDDE